MDDTEISFEQLDQDQTEISEKRYKRFLNTEQKLLIEKTSKKNSQIFTGRIDGGQLTHISKDNISVGDIVNVKIVDTTPFYLKAELL